MAHKGGSKAVRVAKEFAAAAVAGLIVGALVQAANYSGVAATLAGLLTFLLFAIVILLAMGEI